MTEDDFAPDRELAEYLRALDHDSPLTDAESGALAHRILAQAAPLLAVRRTGAEPWWSFAADWSRMLIPLGVTTAAAAAVCILWAMQTAPQFPAEPAIAAALTDGLVSQRLLNDLVAPVEQQVVPVASRERQ